MNELMGKFHHYFEVLTDDNSTVADAAFRLRYQVYCLETGFEDSSAFADERETDAFDSWSVHAVIKHRSSASDVATVRLVKSQSDGSQSGFPIEHQCPDILVSHGVDEQILPRHLTAEISRFAVSKLMKRRTTDAPDSPTGISETSSVPEIGAPDHGRSNYPLVTVGLFLALVRLSAAHDITHWIAVMEPALLRLLGRFGIKFVPIGGVIDYHGRRQPCYGRVADVLGGIYKVQPELWHLITDSGASSFDDMPFTQAQPDARWRD